MAAKGCMMVLQNLLLFRTTASFPSRCRDRELRQMQEGMKSLTRRVCTSLVQGY